jgi:sec-independent protein translocase protein TatA
MGGMSPWHWAVIAGVALLLFGGRGKLSGFMGETARGIRAFQDELKGSKETTEPPPLQLTSQENADATAPSGPPGPRS